jgi:hypothetical protein
MPGVLGRQLYLYQVFHLKPVLIIGSCGRWRALVNYPLTHTLPPAHGELQILADIQTYYNHHYQFAMHKGSHGSVF